MEVGRTSHIRATSQTGRKNGKTELSSRALTIQGEFTGDSGHGTRSGGRPDRRTSAFLAHLSLQYDGIAARRRERAERLEMAIASYGTDAGLRAARLLQSELNLRV